MHIMYIIYSIQPHRYYIYIYIGTYRRRIIYSSHGFNEPRPWSRLARAHIHTHTRTSNIYAGSRVCVRVQAYIIMSYVHTGIYAIYNICIKINTTDQSSTTIRRGRRARSGQTSPLCPARRPLQLYNNYITYRYNRF